MIAHVNGIDIYYEIIGSGKPLVLLHGNGEDHHTFDELADVMKENYQVVLIDSRCHGLSEKNIEISFDLMAMDVISLLEYLNIKDVTLLGFSDGGIVGLKIATMREYLLNKLILCGVNFHPKGVKKEFYKQLKGWYKKNKSPLIKLMMKEPKFKIKDLKQITVDTTILVGEHDLIDIDHTYKLHQYIYNSSLYVLNDENHESYVMHQTKLKDFIL